VPRYAAFVQKNKAHNFRPFKRGATHGVGYQRTHDSPAPPGYHLGPGSTTL
jgi:hypothetical protein